MGLVQVGVDGLWTCEQNLRYLGAEKSHLHVTSRSIPFANNKIATAPIIPRHVEVSPGVVIEINVSKVIGPILDRIDAVLAGFKSVLEGRRTGDLGNGSRNYAGESEGPHI
jgi:hypothetical protein